MRDVYIFIANKFSLYQRFNHNIQRFNQTCLIDSTLMSLSPQRQRWTHRDSNPVTSDADALHQTCSFVCQPGHGQPVAKLVLSWSLENNSEAKALPDLSGVRSL